MNDKLYAAMVVIAAGFSTKVSLDKQAVTLWLDSYESVRKYGPWEFEMVVVAPFITVCLEPASDATLCALSMRALMEEVGDFISYVLL